MSSLEAQFWGDPDGHRPPFALTDAGRRRLSEVIGLSFSDLLEEMWLADHYLKKLLETSGDIPRARDRLFDYLDSLERHYYNTESDRHFKDLPMVEKNNARECIRVLKNVIRTENEREAGYSALASLYGLAQQKAGALKHVGEGFIAEFVYLFRGINGRSGLLVDDRPRPDSPGDPGGVRDPSRASQQRSAQLDGYSQMMAEHFGRYRTGLDPGVAAMRARMKGKVLGFFGAGEAEWRDPAWQMAHIVRDRETLSSVVALERDEVAGLKHAEKGGVPFQITPYYLSLFDEGGRSDVDRAIRAQVLPSRGYVR
ncbi:MAG TPA: hypothetical protein VLT35_03240, partial [Methanocella sp.]|nr:hypothetical protein [Methanocella sp.]